MAGVSLMIKKDQSVSELKPLFKKIIYTLCISLFPKSIISGHILEICYSDNILR